ncbi:hypothetical protein [Spirosoma sordidisoli]|uniref:Uncharacterized protein n=1 Tax=Spirosoma sordidisoli TaxID=2502893 RepID=A0A4Q2UK19_9BACT|nr:hypothetical protein [Spirosoma sordidisoli]RYC69604.1 hypothetical protein EQG79_13455 [Spirosoma sordidisoli]
MNDRQVGVSRNKKQQYFLPDQQRPAVIRIRYPTGRHCPVGTFVFNFYQPLNYTIMEFFNGVRQNGEAVEIKVNGAMGVTLSNGYSRPKDAGRWIKANASLPKYLQLLLALKSEPKVSSELAFKAATKSFLADEKSHAITRLVPEGAYNAAATLAAIDQAYNELADARKVVREKAGEVAGLVAYRAKNEKPAKPVREKKMTKTEAMSLVRTELAAGRVPAESILKIAGLTPVAK